MGGGSGGGGRGAYFLSNDRYLDWTIALLESVRAWNPDLPLHYLPFDDDCGRTARLAARYRFTVGDAAALRWLDDAGRALRPASGGDDLPVGTFRRFACFWGPFEQFVFVDSDVVVTCDLDRVIDSLDRTGSAITYMHAAPLDVVYADPATLPAPPRFGMNAGVWASRRGVLTPESFRALAGELRPHRHQVVNSDQTVLSYFVDTTGLPAARFDAPGAIDLGYRHGWLWAGDRWDGVTLAVRKRRGLPVLQSHGTDAAIVHWAGCALTTTMAHRDLWRRYRWFGAGAGARTRRALDRAAGGARSALGRGRRLVVGGGAGRR